MIASDRILRASLLCGVCPVHRDGRVLCYVSTSRAEMAREKDREKEREREKDRLKSAGGTPSSKTPPLPVPETPPGNGTLELMKYYNARQKPTNI